eukprot:TRINITY_DN4248_c0_g1_i1.p4 TRINITY_DN4248_c0_g1~~TRINITY_DN4248_c0_g1_i1.p4  ORF type:complete len:240 (+),score=61.81 TRINITY_DN4248_c0_g1_i1:1197-1916(+)
MGRKSVLYLHGFQEDEVSPKPAHLRAVVEGAGHAFHFVPLGMYLTRWHSPIRYGLSSGVGLCCLLAGAAAWTLLGPWWGVGLYAASMFVLKNSVIRTGVSRSYEETYAIAAAAVEEHQPDVIAGFSWGGALALELKNRRGDTRPLLLMAPAYHLLQRLRDPLVEPRPPTCGKNAPHGAAVFIHSDDDPLVPMAETEALAEHLPNTTLHRVEGQGHPLWGTVESGLLQKTLLDLLRCTDC